MLRILTPLHLLKEIPEVLPSWRSTMDLFYKKVLYAGSRLIHLIALALKLDEDFFEKVGASDIPTAFLRLIHYPGELDSSGEEIYGASAHSDYGMITLLATDGVPGLQQVCREKFKEPRVWEDVPSIKGAFIVNIGDMMERWTNCLFRSTLHRVMPTGQERYSAAFFLDPNNSCVVECLESCCSESCPPRFPPIRSGDYLKKRFRLTYGS
ncbi:2-oxoglutarate-Fe(II) type oxidoreductase hxnY isoform X4 [Pistacia vera]|uniref:2-oxoglutarate-Fe(II) type oxidoreductase hxnY isoform X4 n=1 Tax=Pistacia vera TaxID=55513 RepID=UPI001263B679|nr:2-oxoglutarate-Fe(II) type oxidoreductase hxnY isoform X4 [Pistacia vera]